MNSKCYNSMRMRKRKMNIQNQKYADLRRERISFVIKKSGDTGLT